MTRQYIIKPIRDIISFYPNLTRIPVPDSWKNHFIILITTKNYKYDFGRSSYITLAFDDVFYNHERFINEKHLMIIKEIISKLDNITLLIVGCDAGLSRSPAVAAAIARCVGDEIEAKKILKTYPHLNTDIFDVITSYVTKKNNI